MGTDIQAVFCTTCGAELAGRARFCTNCGAERRKRSGTQMPPHEPPDGGYAPVLRRDEGSAAPRAAEATVPLSTDAVRRLSENAPAVDSLPTPAEVVKPETPLAPIKARHKWYRPHLRPLSIAVAVAALTLLAALLFGDTGRAANYTRVSRVSGFVLYELLTATVALGMFLSLRWRPFTGVWLVAERLHPWVLLAAGVVTAIHIVSLLLIAFPVGDALSPIPTIFSLPNLRFGIQSMSLGALVFLSTYLIRYVGFRNWRLLHYSAFVVWALALLHGITRGPDTGTWWAWACYLIGAVLIAALTIARMARVRLSEGVPPPSHSES